MTDELPPQFLPWLRTGLTTRIGTVAVNGLAPHDTAAAAVAVRLRSTGTSAEVVEAIAGPEVVLRGPAGVVGLDPAQVLRQDPPPGTLDAEINYFTVVEFASADLVWRFTPAAPGADKLQPWIALVVVEERDGVWLEDRGPALRPVLHIDDPAAELPDPAQCWAWAHTQATHELPNGVAAALAAEPTAFRSRLMCPRRLHPNRAWLACVVPTFEAGRRAALGEPGGVDLGLAWSVESATEVRLPVYHHWRFSTGESGDFESLVRRLTPRELPAEVGRRDLDIGTPGGGLPSAPGTLVTFSGALVSPAGGARIWPAEHRTVLKQAFRRTLNAAAARTTEPAGYDALRDDPVVGAPAYAAHQAQRRRVPAEDDPPVWFEELNTEPMHRAVAGLGADVVRLDQEALMAAAWTYAAGLRGANHTLGLARLAWELAGAAQPKVARLADESLVQVLGPALGRLRLPSGTTVRGAEAASALPRGLLTGGFRRLCATTRSFALAGPDAAVVVPTRAVTAVALDDPAAFVAGWATRNTPAGIEVATEATAAARVATPRDAPGDIIVNRPSALATDVRTAFDPQVTLVSMVESRIAGLPTERAHEVPARLTVRPRFTTPMYERLLALSVDYLVPGIGTVPDNTLGLLEVNPSYVEAWLAGFNHEMGREFVWREYPALPSATWAQHFWSSDFSDIRTIRSWDPAAGLGSNRPQQTPDASLVLLIKGALPRRYPDLRVYAVEATWDGAVRRERTDGAVRVPVFAGLLQRDTFFYGFELTEAEARGSTVAPNHPGYFFVLEQRPFGARFGLDTARPAARGVPPALWSGLSWANLVGPEDPLPDFVDVTGPSWMVGVERTGNGGEDTWGADAAHMARITLQRPVRMLVHADSMLPPPTAPGWNPPPGWDPRDPLGDAGPRDPLGRPRAPRRGVVQRDVRRFR